MNKDYYAGMTEGRIQERERIVDVLWDSIDDERDAPGWRWKRELIRNLILQIEPRRKCLSHNEGKFDAGCTCKRYSTEGEKGIADE